MWRPSRFQHSYRYRVDPVPYTGCTRFKADYHWEGVSWRKLGRLTKELKYEQELAFAAAEVPENVPHNIKMRRTLIDHIPD